MGGKFSRDKGKRGELDFVHRLGGSAQRKGHSWVPTLTDVESDFAHYQVKNKTIGGANICDILLALDKVVQDGKNKYVAFKARQGVNQYDPGVWIICELLTQHKDDHGEEVT